MLEKNNEMENSLNPEEKEPSEQETFNEEQETSKQPETSVEQAEAQRDRLYARLKKEEEKRKELEKKLGESSKSKEPSGDVDLDDLADRLSALQGLDSVERARLLKESKLQGASLEDARKSEDYKFWRSSYRAKRKETKSPQPSTKQSGEEVQPGELAQKLKGGTITVEEWDRVKGDPEKLRKFLRQAGLIRDYTPRRPGPAGSTRPHDV